MAPPRRVPTRERMSSVDAAWWHMSRPHNPMVIVGVLGLARAPALKALRAIVTERLLVHARFRQRPVHVDGTDYWEQDRHFRLDRHLRRREIDQDGDAGLQALTAQLSATPFDPAHPQWELALIRRPDRRAALLLRLHHCYADGAALIRLLNQVSDRTDDAAEIAAQEPRIEPPPSMPAPSRVDPAQPPSLLDELMQLLAEAEQALGLEPAGTDHGSNPGPAPGIRDATTAVSHYARVALTLGREVLRLAEMPDESPTPFKGTPGPTKCVAWCDALPAAEAKAVGKAFGCSVHALMLSCVAGALGEQMSAMGHAVRATEVRVLVPAPVRSVKRSAPMQGNHFGLVNLALPLGITNPVARAWDIHRRLQALSNTRQALLMYVMLGVIGLLPHELRIRVFDALADKATAVVTSVPGPLSARYLAGSRIDDMMFWVPQAGEIGMGVSIMSYDGRIRIGLMSDAGLLPNPQQVLDRVRREFDRLPALARVLEAQQNRPEPAI